MTLKQLEKRVAAMERRVAKLEQKKPRSNGRKRNGTGKSRSPSALRSNTSTLSQQEKQKLALQVMRQQGMIVDLPEEAKKRAARWRALPEEERKRIMDEFAQLPLEKPLSQIIIENRR